MSPADRYNYDYVSDERPFEDGVYEDCLFDSPYRTARVDVHQTGPDSLVVTPIARRMHVLSFVGLEDANRPLQPADTVTSDVLANYGCHTGSDGGVNIVTD